MSNTSQCLNMRCRRHNDSGSGGVCTHCNELHTVIISKTPTKPPLTLGERLGCDLLDTDCTKGTKNTKWANEL